MANLTANQLYNLSGSASKGIKFNQWIESEKNNYQSKIDSGAIAGQMPFLSWLNKRWLGKMNVAGPIIDQKTLDAIAKEKASKDTFGKKLLNTSKDIAASVLEKTLEKAKGGKSTTSTAAEAGAGYVAPEHRILGLKPIVAYSIVTVLVVGTIAGTVYLVKKSKANAQ